MRYMTEKKQTFAYINMLVVVKSHEAVTSLVKFVVFGAHASPVEYVN